MKQRLESLIFDHRKSVLTAFSLVTLAMAALALQLSIDAGFKKLLPLQHPYMKTFLEFSDEFGGANRVLIALMARQGDIFTPEFLNDLNTATDEIFFLPGVDRSRVQSLFTPNVRFTEVVAGGISGGNVVPADFSPDAESISEIRENVLKAGIVGRLVANDFTGAMISIELLEYDPDTGARLDYVEVAAALEKLRVRLEDQYSGDGIDIHIIGFAKVVGDITEGAGQVLLFFALTFLITAFLVYLYAHSIFMTVSILCCSLVAVIWQLGLLPVLGFGLDPMSILVPFLIFAIAVSHGTQMISAIRVEVYLGANFEQASRRAFQRLLLPGTVALASDTIGFITILIIDIGIIREMAITASIGVAVIVLTNLILLPVLVSYMGAEQRYREYLELRTAKLAGVWRVLSAAAGIRGSILILSISALLMVYGLLRAVDVKIGDLHQGVPELRADSRYNVDSGIITDKFSIGVDVLTVFVQVKPEGCIDFSTMQAVDDFAWRMSNLEGVRSVLALPQIAKVINAGWNEGDLRWRVLPRNQHALVQATSPVDTSTGLLNNNCSVLPVVIFTTDHKAGTIESIVSEVKRHQENYGTDDLKFRLAGSNVGVMAAVNEAVADAQFPILIYVYAAIILLCALSFRSVLGTLCIVIPLALVSLLTYALMSVLDIGLKVNTLPVVALGVGIGVDYGIYILSRFQSLLDEEYSIETAYQLTLTMSGFGVVCTGFALAVGVATWIFSPLQFQADIGILLTFMFIMNMLGAIFLLPALARWLMSPRTVANPSG